MASLKRIPETSSRQRTPKTNESVTNAPTVPVRVRLFGTPMIEVAPAQPAHLLERHDAALLAIIATEGPQDRARVAPLLWPDAPLPRSHLRQRLHRMKREVGRSLFTSDGPLAFLPDVEVDVRRLEMDLRRDDSASRGALLGDLDYCDIDTLQAWVDRARISESARRADLLAQLSSELEDRRLLAGALRYAQRIVFDSPTLEHGHRRLMWLHYLRGDRAAALDAYARCGVILRRDVDQEPDAETQALARLIAAGRGRPSIVFSKKTGLTRPPRMVGRDAAWRAFAQSRADQAVLLVRGDAGIGKSRVLEELALSVEGAIVAGALPGDSHFAYGTLSRILEAIAGRFDVPKVSWVVSELSRIVPAFGAAPSDALDATRIGRAFESALDEWRQQGLQAIFVDDLQYADDASVEALLPRLSTRPTGGADLLIWVLAARSRPPEAFERWCTQSIGRGLTILDLVPLDAVAIHELLRSLVQDDLDEPRWIAALLRHVGGNPLFVLETVRAIALERDAGHIVDVDAIPRAPNVADLIDQRLSLLSERARHLAQVAAIA